MNKNHIVYVSGILRGTPPPEVCSAFKSYGYSIRVVDRHGMSLESSTAITTGYCLVEAECHKTYKTILKEGHISWKGRSLILRPYLTGEHLFKENRRNNKRRVVLKHVPVFVSDKEVKEILSQRFGPIREFYELQSDLPLYLCGKRKFKAYSVMFDHSVGVHEMETSTKLELRVGIISTIEKFNIKKKKHISRDSLNHLKIFTARTWAGSEENFQSSKVPPLSLEKVRCSPILSKSHKSTSARVIHSQSPHLYDLKPRRVRSVSQNKKSSTGYSYYEFINNLKNSQHHIKPNRKFYRLIRENSPEFLGAFQLKDSWVALSNLRQNYSSWVGAYSDQNLEIS